MRRGGLRARRRCFPGGRGYAGWVANGAPTPSRREPRPAAERNVSLLVTSHFWQPGSFAKQPAAMTVRSRRFDDDDVARNLRGYARIPRRELLPVYNLHVFTVTRRVGVGENAARESGRRYTYIVSKHLSRNIMHNNVGGGLLLCRLLTRGRASMVKRFSASVV